MKRKGSYIASKIDKEYRNTKRYKEMMHFRDTYCINCANVHSDLCEIRRTLDRQLKCVYYKEKK